MMKIVEIFRRMLPTNENSMKTCFYRYHLYVARFFWSNYEVLRMNLNVFDAVLCVIVAFWVSIWDINEGFWVDCAWFRGRCAKIMLARVGIWSSDGL